MINKKYLEFILSCSFLTALTCTAFATTNNFEVSIASGLNWTHADNTHLAISSDEIDKDQISYVTTNPIAKIGVGYDFFNRVLLELNLYRSTQTIRGDVWQYEMSEFNNYQFKAPLTSTRLMLDLKPRLFTWNRISPYVVLGAGAAWNTLSYKETATGSGVDSDSALSLSKKTNHNVAFDAGLGAQVVLTDRFNLSLEYLYTNLGKVSSSEHSQTQVSLTSPPKFTLYSQAALLSLSWTL